MPLGATPVPPGKIAKRAMPMSASAARMVSGAAALLRYSEGGTFDPGNQITA